MGPGLAIANPTATAELLRSALDQAFAIYEQDARGDGEAVVDLQIAEACVRLRLAGPALVQPVLSALLHRRVALSLSPDLTIFVFDKASTGLAPDIIEALDRHGDNSSAITTWTDAGLHLMYRREPIPNLLGFDQSRNIALLWLSDAVDMPRWDRCRPLLQLLHWWLARSDWQPVHAAAVCGPKGGVLIAGKGGAGKSTTALACLRAGWRYAGDDYVLVSSTPQPRVENLFGTARLRMDMLERFPELHGTVTNSERVGTYEKAEIMLTERYEHASIAGFPVRAILLPQHGENTGYAARGAARPQAMLTLAPTTMMVLQSETAVSFRRIAAFVAATPAYWLDVGSDLDRIPAAIESILERVPP
jgi:hypothetical protein